MVKPPQPQKAFKEAEQYLELCRQRASAAAERKDALNAQLEEATATAEQRAVEAKRAAKLRMQLFDEMQKEIREDVDPDAQVINGPMAEVGECLTKIQAVIGDNSPDDAVKQVAALLTGMIKKLGGAMGVAPARSSRSRSAVRRPRSHSRSPRRRAWEDAGMSDGGQDEDERAR
eukprot:8501115-Alexandrium_andersonii.AAC.2